MARGQMIIHTAGLHRESIASGCSGRGPPRGRLSTSRRRRLYRRNGLARQRGSPASRGSEPNRRAQRGYTPRSGPRMAASSASTPHQPLRPIRAGSPSGSLPHDAAPPPSLSETRHQLRSPDWATIRPSFTLRRFTKSRERLRSAARGKRVAKTAGLFASPLHCLVSPALCRRPFQHQK